MTVYVDNMRRRYGRMVMSHMLADTDTRARPRRLPMGWDTKPDHGRRWRSLGVPVPRRAGPEDHRKHAMSVCAHRPETPGAFIACTVALGFKPCACGQEVENDPNHEGDS